MRWDFNPYNAIRRISQALFILILMDYGRLHLAFESSWSAGILPALAGKMPALQGLPELFPTHS